MYTYHFAKDNMEYSVEYDIIPAQKATYDQPFCPEEVDIIDITRADGKECEFTDDELLGLSVDILEAHDYDSDESED